MNDKSHAQIPESSQIKKLSINTTEDKRQYHGHNREAKEITVQEG